MIKLKERNQKVIKKVLENSPEIKEWRDAFTERHGVDPLNQEKLPFMKENFSWKKLRSKLMKESDSSSSFAQFLRLS